MSSALRLHKHTWRTPVSLIMTGVLTTACALVDLGANTPCLDRLVWKSGPDTDPGGLMTGVERFRVRLTIDLSETAARTRFGQAIRSSASVGFVAWPLVPGTAERVEDANGAIASITIEGGGPAMTGAYHRAELSMALADCPANASCHREFVATIVVISDPSPRTFRWSQTVVARVGEEVCDPVLVGEVTISATFIDRVGGAPVTDAGVIGPFDGG